MESCVLRVFFLLICNLDLALKGANAIDYVPVEDNDPGSTMYLWRPVNILFIGDRHFRSLEETVVLPTNVTEFYLYSQSILNAVSFMIREDDPSCDIKLKTSGTYVVTEDEDKHFMPRPGSYPELGNMHHIQSLVERNTAASLADIVIVVLGMHRTGQLNDARSTCKEVREFYRSALAQEEGLMCFNTPYTCCPPLFFGMFNIRRESFCAQVVRVLGLHGTYVNFHCTTFCKAGTMSQRNFYWTPPGWVWDQSSDYWRKSLLCPKPDDEVCSGRFGHYHAKRGLTYKKFQKVLTYIWDLHDYEVPDTEAAICRL
ncbi:uncharacterized protein LOC135369302 isoform X2 [Ornithodoros turicata]|uniref:uncharacterized protein LOC135369302 isoform X2 n=1 Tax=Ornithodoros turicata TaxID=34597 RepID=UPI00313908BC